jgi:hypothetical protein
MKKLFTLLLLLSVMQVQAQERREPTAEEKATHNKNVTGIMGRWVTIETAIKIVEPELKPKQEELDKVYKALFAKSNWEFINTGKFALTTVTDGKPSSEKGDFTITAQFLTLYLSGKTYRCLMKIEEDGKLVIHFPIAGQSIFALQLEKQK